MGINTVANALLQLEVIHQSSSRFGAPVKTRNEIQNEINDTLKDTGSASSMSKNETAGLDRASDKAVVHPAIPPPTMITASVQQVSDYR